MEHINTISIEPKKKIIMNERSKDIYNEAKKFVAETEKTNLEEISPLLRLIMIVCFTMGAKWADAHPHWISVEDELPQIGKDVLVLRKDGSIHEAHQCNEEIAMWWSVDGYPLKNNITHWMPLPQAPKKGGNQ